MPFFGFLGGIALATLVLIVWTCRQGIFQGGRINFSGVPKAAVLLLAAYLALFGIMWAYFFDGVLSADLYDDPNWTPYLVVRILRSFLFQMEQWDFIVTLLAFVAGGLLVLAMDRAAASTSPLSAPPVIGGANPAPAADGKSDGDGVVAASLRQLKRITALNLLLVFALILVTLPALLPWVERRLDFVKVGGFEARLAPLAENTRRTSTPDTPALATQKNLSNYLSISASIDNATAVLEVVPDLADNTDISIVERRQSYDVTDRFFTETVIPRVVRMYCIENFAGVGIPDIPGAREASSAFLAALRAERTGEELTNLQKAIDVLSTIDEYYGRYYSHLSKECSLKLNGLLKEELFDEHLKYIPAGLREGDEVGTLVD